MTLRLTVYVFFIYFILNLQKCISFAITLKRVPNVPLASACSISRNSRAVESSGPGVLLLPSYITGRRSSAAVVSGGVLSVVSGGGGPGRGAADRSCSAVSTNDTTHARNDDTDTKTATAVTGADAERSCWASLQLSA